MDLERHLTESHAVQWAVIIVASALDITTTMVGVERGAREGNTVAQAFIETYGTPGIGFLKFVVLVVVVILWGTLPDRYGTVILTAFAFVTLLVVSLNLLTLTAL